MFVTAGWLVSLCLHEFAHAYMAYRGGDRSVSEQGYLTLNPLRYGDALLSVALPLLVLLVGGLGLPGGAVRVDPGHAQPSAAAGMGVGAGPLANVLVVSPLLAVLVLAGPRAGGQVAFWSGVAFLVFLEVTVILLPAVRTIAWLAGCRRLRIRYDRRSEWFFAFAMLAGDRLCYNRLPSAATARLP